MKCWESIEWMNERIEADARYQTKVEQRVNMKECGKSQEENKMCKTKQEQHVKHVETLQRTQDQLKPRTVNEYQRHTIKNERQKARIESKQNKCCFVW